MDNQKIWIENPTIFIKNQGYLNFLPNRTMTKTEQINSLTLLLIYVLILLYILPEKIYNINDEKIIDTNLIEIDNNIVAKLRKV